MLYSKTEICTAIFLNPDKKPHIYFKIAIKRNVNTCWCIQRVLNNELLFVPIQKSGDYNVVNKIISINNKKTGEGKVPQQLYNRNALSYRDGFVPTYEKS